MSDLVKKIKDDEVYEKIVFDNDHEKDDILNALEVVKLYIIKKSRILVGGMSIDFALRKKEKTLYDENTLPDYDFFSPQFHQDAYSIADELHKAGLTRISVINAYHASTMRVRINFQTVADCTYVPKNIYDGLPTVSFENFRIIHPHYQMLNQHLSLSQPYSGAPWETISRWKKDMKRYGILDKEYPVDNKYDKPEQRTIEAYQEFNIDVKKIQDLCLNGFGALLYWFNLAKKDGFADACDGKDLAEYQKLGSADIVGNKLKIKMPRASLGEEETLGLSFYCDRREIMKHPFLSTIEKNSKSVKRFHAFLDLMPRRIVVDDQYEIVDNRGNMVSAHKEKIWVANLQVLLKYFLMNYMVSFSIMKLRDGYCFYLAYKLAYEIVKWAGVQFKNDTNKKKIMKYLPTQEVFGKYNWHETYILQRKMFQMTLGKIPREQSEDKPRQAFIDSPDDYPVDKLKYNFKPDESEIYNFDYKEHKGTFEPLYLYDPDIDAEP